MEDTIIPLVSIVSLFIVAPAIVFTFIGLGRRSKARIELERLKKEQLELELRKEEVHLQVLAEEGRKYDRIIDDRRD